MRTNKRHLVGTVHYTVTVREWGEEEIPHYRATDTHPSLTDATQWANEQLEGEGVEWEAYIDKYEWKPETIEDDGDIILHAFLERDEDFYAFKWAPDEGWALEGLTRAEEQEMGL